MCGIVAVLGRPSSRPAPAAGAVRDALASALRSLQEAAGSPGPRRGGRVAAVQEAAAALSSLDQQLRGVAGLTCLISDADLEASVRAGTVRADDLVSAVEAALDSGEAPL